MGLAGGNLQICADNGVEERGAGLAYAAADFVNRFAACDRRSGLIPLLRRTLASSPVEGKGFESAMFVVRLVLPVFFVVKEEISPKRFISSALVTAASRISGVTKTVPVYTPPSSQEVTSWYIASASIYTPDSSLLKVNVFEL